MSETRRQWLRRGWLGGVAAAFSGLLVSRRALAEHPRSRWMQKIHGRFDSTGDYLRLDMWVSDDLVRDSSFAAVAVLHKQAMEQINFAVAAKREYLLTGKWPEEWMARYYRNV